MKIGKLLKIIIFPTSSLGRNSFKYPSYISIFFNTFGIFRHCAKYTLDSFIIPHISTKVHIFKCHLQIHTAPIIDEM